MIPTLPFDVLQIVLEALDDKASLANCCLASKILLNISRPLLYREVEILVKGTPRITRSGASGLMPWTSFQTQETLRRTQKHASVAALVQTVRISMIASTVGGQVPSATFDLEKIVKGFPKLKTIFLVDSLELQNFDTTIARLQRSRPSILNVHVKHWEPRLTSPLTAAYKTLEINARYLTLDSPFTPISASITSLKVICDRFFERGLTLAAFTNLRQLEFHSLTIPARKFTPPFTVPTNRFGAILEELQHLETLEEIVLSDTGGFCADLLRRWIGFVASIGIPPSVVTLSLDRTVDAALLLEFVQSLPASTGLKRLESRSTRGDPTKIEEECEKRGIRLAFF